MIISKTRLNAIQSMLCDLLDAVPVLEQERDQLTKKVTELERENRRLRDAAAALQVQRDKYMRSCAKLESEAKFLSAVLDNVSAKYNDELMDASISTALDIGKGA